MTLKYFVLITIFSVAGLVHAQEEEENVIVVEDVILKESLRKQGIPTSPRPAQSANRQDIADIRGQNQQRQQQRQQQNANQSDQDQIEKLQKQVESLRQQVQNLKQKHEASPQVAQVELGKELTNSNQKGDIGKFSISEGQTTARVARTAQQRQEEERQIPALKICATMADVNRMNQEDFQFLGFDQEVARRIVQARERLGEFKSSKQITTVEGVTPEIFQAVQEDIIAIRSQRLAE